MAVYFTVSTGLILEVVSTDLAQLYNYRGQKQHLVFEKPRHTTVIYIKVYLLFDQLNRSYGIYIYLCNKIQSCVVHISKCIYKRLFYYYMNVYHENLFSVLFRSITDYFVFAGARNRDDWRTNRAKNQTELALAVDK